MSVSFVVFHTGVDTLPIYEPLMRVSREALSVTNPGARYVVLTDKETAPKLEKEFDVEVLAPVGPLMRQYVWAQMEYEKKADGLVVLAATDCVAWRDLTLATPEWCGMGITYRLRGKNLINNIAYVRDHDKAAWFLRKAIDCMKPEHYEFWGDQQSWEDVLGPSTNWGLMNPGDKPESLRRTFVEQRAFYLFPCRSHNHFVKRSGALSGTAKKAFLLHYKGSRKLVMVRSVDWHLFGRAPQGRPNFKEARQEAELLPMEERRLKCGQSWSDIRDIGDKN